MKNAESYLNLSLINTFNLYSSYISALCLSDITSLAHEPVNQTSWVAEVTQTDRPISVRNRYVI